MGSLDFTRREAIPVAAAGIASLYASTLAAETLPTDIDKIISILVREAMAGLEINPPVLAHVSKKRFWGIDEDGDVDDLPSMLASEAKMSIPGIREIADLRSRLGPKLKKHLAKTPAGEYSAFIDGDFDRVKKKEQTMYLIRNDGKDGQYVMKLPLSASFEEFSNKPDSKGSPIGTFRVTRVERGLFGQLTSNVALAHKFEKPKRGSEAEEALKDFVPLPVTVNGKDYSIGYFPKSIVRGDKLAAITSGVLWVDEKRTIGAHGSNKIGGLGYPASDGCFRISNLAIFYLLSLLEIGSLITVHGTPLTATERRVNKLLGEMKYK